MTTIDQMMARLSRHRGSSTPDRVASRTWGTREPAYTKGKINGKMTSTNNEFFFSTDDAEDLYKGKMFYERLLKGESTYCKRISAFFDEKKVEDLKLFMAETHGFNTFEISEWTQFLINEELGIIVDFKIDSNKVYIKINGNKSQVEELSKIVEEQLDTFTSHIEWYYSSGGHSCSETLPIRYDNLPVQEMYPFLNGKPIEEYYEEYMDSNSAILMLMGPPGTGKTTFIKGLLNYSKESAILSYNAKMLDDDEIFVKFLTGPIKFMIIEDSDVFLQKRTDGNTMMHRFLNVSDGLISIRGKKLIFTSNLGSLNDVDEALTRKGRCYDILQFDTLNREQAQNLADKFGRTLKDGSEFTIADVLAQDPDKVAPKRMGF